MLPRAWYEKCQNISEEATGEQWAVPGNAHVAFPGGHSETLKREFQYE